MESDKPIRKEIICKTLLYLKRWDNQADLIDWQARDELAESTVRIKKLETDAKKISEIEKIMLPLRVQFARYNSCAIAAAWMRCKQPLSAPLPRPRVWN